MSLRVLPCRETRAEPSRGASSNLERILGPLGLLAKSSSTYEDRPQQREMARLVLDAILWGRHLVVEAGTGTGKTLAYLVPAILSGRKVVVSTATRALQEQVFRNDLPLLFDLLGGSFRAACLKGRSNYVCLARKARFEIEPLFPFREDAKRYEMVREWLRNTETGDIADLSGVPEDWHTYRELVSTTDTCAGQKCPHYEDCFVTRARGLAAAADIVVVNHHLFFADLSLRASIAGRAGGAEVIPRYDAVIFDEAHAIEEIATTFFGICLSNHKVRDLARDTLRAARERPETSLLLRTRAASLETKCDNLFLALDLRDGRNSLDPPRVARATREIEALAESLELLAAAAFKDDDDELLALQRRARDLRCTLDEVLRARAPGRVQWTEVRGPGCFLHSSPIDAASELREHLLASVETCVFTSATLSSDGNFDFFRNRVGLAEKDRPLFDCDSALLASPFDFSRQAALYVPEDMPPPNDAAFTRGVAEEVRRLSSLTEGRAFVLCTSHRNMESIYELLAVDSPWPLLKQGQAPKGALLDRFRRTPSLLVATQSFWEGVDVPGDALSLVVVDKLPFAPPNDPVLAARILELRLAGQCPFTDLQLPQAALALKQGFGRLIRTARDRGIVAVCDIRLAEKGYRKHFLRSLPSCPRFRRLEDLQEWWWAGPK